VIIVPPAHRKKIASAIVFGFAGAFERRALDRCGLALGRPILVPRAVDETRRDGVDADLGR